MHEVDTKSQIGAPGIITCGKCGRAGRLQQPPDGLAFVEHTAQLTPSPSARTAEICFVDLVEQPAPARTPLPLTEALLVVRHTLGE